MSDGYFPIWKIWLKLLILIGFKIRSRLLRQDSIYKLS